MKLGILYLVFMFYGCVYDTKIPEPFSVYPSLWRNSFHRLSHNSLYGLQEMEVTQCLACGAHVWGGGLIHETLRSGCFPGSDTEI